MSIESHRSAPLPNGRFLVVAAVLVGVCSFVYRFLTFRGLSDDNYMHLGWAQQLLFGELPGRDFVDPGLPLQYAVSAVIQWLWPGPFSEGLASIAFIALASGCAVLVVGRMTSSVAAGVAAGAITTAPLLRLYGYPKLLVPAVTLLLVARYTRRPASMGLLWLAIWSVVAGLLRHDLGVFAVLAVSLALMTMAGATDRTRNLARYLALVAVVSLPYLVFVQWNEGLLEHLRIGNEFAKSDQHQLMLYPSTWPLFERFTPVRWVVDEPATLLFWLTHVLLVVTGIMAVRAWRRGGPEVAVLAAGFVFLLCYRLTILRHALPARVGDLAALYGICGVVTTVSALRWARRHLTRRPVLALATAVTTIAVAVSASLAMDYATNLRGELYQSSLLLGPRAIVGRVITVVGRGTSGSWDDYWPAGAVPSVIPYLTSCTGAGDRLLTTWPASEYHFFTRRPFAAGHLEFFHRNSFSSERDQTLALERLQHQYVPVVLINERDYGEFQQAFSMIAHHIATHYERRGQFTIREGSQVLIAVRKDLRPRRTFGDERWPCDFESQPDATDTAE